MSLSPQQCEIPPSSVLLWHLLCIPHVLSPHSALPCLIHSNWVEVFESAYSSLQCPAHTTLHTGYYAHKAHVWVTEGYPWALSIPNASFADMTGGPTAMLISVLFAFFYQIWRWGDEVSGVHHGHQADIIAVMHEDIDGYNIPLVFPWVQLQYFFGDNFMAIWKTAK